MTSISGLLKVNTQFQPIQLRCHEKSITAVKYNLDGDLLFSASKDKYVAVWYTDSGERLGTYGPHGGSVNDVDPSWDSKYLATACGDGVFRVYETTTGQLLAETPHVKQAGRCIKWGDGNNRFFTSGDAFTEEEPANICIYDVPNKLVSSRLTRLEPSIVITFDDPKDKVVSLAISLGDEYIIAGFELGYLRKYEVNTGKEVLSVKVHEKRINKLNFNRDKSMLITASMDESAKMIDPVTFDVIREYKTDRPVNSAVFSPTHPHIILGGGQAAHAVTTSNAQGGFETRFFHMVYGEEFGRVKGHFGPINDLDVHPFGRGFASCSVDGFIRLHHFDANYMNMDDYIPDDFKM